MKMVGQRIGNVQDYRRIMAKQEHPQFKSRAQREQEQDLRAKYGELGNPELVEALKHQKRKEQHQPQMQAETPDRD
jgi:hypothetical protein